MTPTKRCTKCGNEYPATKEFFRAKKSGLYGLTGRCKTCIAEDERRSFQEPNDDPNLLKECSQCHVMRPATTKYFYASKGGRYGLKSRCIVCVQASGTEPLNDPSVTKICGTCNTGYPATIQFFYADRHSPMGLGRNCKACVDEYSKQHPRKHMLPLNDSNTSKICGNCGEAFPATTEFFKANKRGRFGLDGWCKKCSQRYDRQYRLDNYEKIRARDREYKSKNKSRIYSVNRKYYLENTEKVLEMCRQYRRKNPDKVRQHLQKWRTENPERNLLINQRRETRKRDLPHNLTEDEWRYAITYWNNHCAYCGERQERLTLDHYIPLNDSNCPGTIATNCIPACRFCNSSKSDLEALYWMTWRFGEEHAKTVQARIMAYFESLKS